MKRIILTLSLLFFFAIAVPQPAYAAATSGTGTSSSTNPLQGAVGGTAKEWVGKNHGIDRQNADEKGNLDYNPWSDNAQIQLMLGWICLDFPPEGDDWCGNGVYYTKMVENSAIASISRGIVAMYDHPAANTYAFVHDAGQSLGFIPKSAYAAGSTGFQGLLPLLPIWKGVRNFAYGIIAIAMMVIGFMIMFRKKIDPKTVMTVQNSIPRIIITLILITFSYAIAGFLIDLMYVLIFLGGQLLPSDVPYVTERSGQTINATTYLNLGPLGLLGAVYGPLVKANPITSFFDTLVETVKTTPKVTFVNVLKTLFSFVAGGQKTGGGYGFGIIWWFVLSIGFLFVYIRLLIKLISAYVQILMAVIFAPIQMVMDVFPGSNQTVEWFKGIIGNILVFPIAIFLLLIAEWITSTIQTNGLWIPPLLNINSANPSVLLSTVVNPAANYLSNNTIMTLLWLGFIFSIPTITDTVKEKLKSKALFGGGLGAVAAPITQTVGGALQVGSQFYQSGQVISGITGFFNRKKTS